MGKIELYQGRPYVPGSGIWTVESSGWCLMGGHGRCVSKRPLGLMCTEEMRTGGRGVRAGIYTVLIMSVFPSVGSNLMLVAKLRVKGCLLLSKLLIFFITIGLANGMTNTVKALLHAPGRTKGRPIWTPALSKPYFFFNSFYSIA